MDKIGFEERGLSLELGEDFFAKKEISLWKGGSADGMGADMLVHAGVNAQCPASRVTPGEGARLSALKDHSQICRDS